MKDKRKQQTIQAFRFRGPPQSLFAGYQHSFVGVKRPGSLVTLAFVECIRKTSCTLTSRMFAMENQTLFCSNLQTYFWIKIRCRLIGRFSKERVTAASNVAVRLARGCYSHRTWTQMSDRPTHGIRFLGYFPPALLVLRCCRYLSLRAYSVGTERKQQAGTRRGGGGCAAATPLPRPENEIGKTQFVRHDYIKRSTWSALQL